ncbi:hypothetical protein OG252_51935 [Streptomyces sp. NBC_01352]|uniref:hypothetical protein n=1 Tax=Streptomyces sp. NBC_01352 TaxID=2903834 RepID=UPI002E317381|nr:hypothetical protein [Streptomyces sp. NBC_01352]
MRQRPVPGIAAVLLPGLVAVVVRRGTDVMWMAQPPIQVSPTGNGEVEIAVAGATEEDQVTAFSAADTRAFLDQLRAEYGPK